MTVAAPTVISTAPEHDQGPAVVSGDGVQLTAPGWPSHPAALFVGTPWRLLVGLGALLAVAVVLNGLEVSTVRGIAGPMVSADVMRVLAVTAGYGGMLATAVAWAAPIVGPAWSPLAASDMRAARPLTGRVGRHEPRRLAGVPWDDSPFQTACATRSTCAVLGRRARPSRVLEWATSALAYPTPIAAVVCVGVAAAAAALHPAGVLAYLGVPAWLAWHAQAGHLARIGLPPRVPRRGLAMGALLGLALGGHLLVSGALTIGYRPLAAGVEPVLRALAQDVGVQIPATELFFRGGLFNRAQRIWSFASACALATGASLVRYLVDPQLPGTFETLAGAVFYMAMLAIASAWLLWRFGSLLAGLVVSTLVFLVYRALTA